MSSKVLHVFRTRALKRSNLLVFENKQQFSNAALQPKESRKLIISCKRPQYNFYSDTVYKKFDDTMLASTGWNHNKSKGDWFAVHPNLNECYENVTPFTALNLHSDLVEALQKQGITEATDFQQQAISTVLDGNHTLLAAETGCGKTIAFLVPIIQNLIGHKTDVFNTPTALILVPNRELVAQTKEIAEALAAPFGLKVLGLVGGSTKKLMMNPELSEVDILVATPGVIGKLSTVGVYKLNNVRCTVLDEADTLIDDSFVDRLNSLIRRVPHSQILLVSATIPKHLPDCLKPVECTLKHVVSPKIHKPLMNISQKFLRLTRSARPGELLHIAKAAKQPLLIFTNNSKTCDWLAMFLRENGMQCANINGEMNKSLRIQQWDDFISGKANILSATDIMSRGINLTQINHVLNYDFPKYMADYLHRIGRTGRFGSSMSCKVTNFVAGHNEVELVQQIEVNTLKVLMEYCCKNKFFFLIAGDSKKATATKC